MSKNLIDKLFFIRNNTGLRKQVRFDNRAEKELSKFPEAVQKRMTALIESLAKDGKLIEPAGKKVDKELFEIRVKFNGQWRVLYAYLIRDYIIILSAFQKKTQKTPLKELDKAKNRLKEYQ